MDLGKLHFTNQHVNVLHQGKITLPKGLKLTMAIHPSHGAVWTDGKAIYLGPVEILQGQVQQQQSLKLGEFEHPVKSVHWSSDVAPSSCYLCVVHHQHVSVWKVDGMAPKLSFKQVRKLNVQPIPQGCLWNPGRDILCILSKHQCSFFFRHVHNRGSYAFPPVESGKINCGTWSDDGSQLVICVGAVLLIYSWPDIDVSISDTVPLAWRIPNLDGGVTSVVSLSEDCLVCATELPLEALCKVKDSFAVPEMKRQDLSKEKDVLIPNGSVSIKDTLLNLPKNPESCIEDTSQLIMIRLQPNKNPVKCCSVGVKAILTPDILLYEPRLRYIVVGSHSQCLLQVYSCSSNALMKIRDIVLEKDERPRGVSNLPGSTTGVLLAVGKRRPAGGLFPSSHSSGENVVLKFFPVSIEDKKNVVPNKPKRTLTPSNSVDSSGSDQDTNIQSQTGSVRLQGRDSKSQSQKSIVKLQNSDEIKPIESWSLKSQGAANNSQSESVDMLLKRQKTMDELKDYSDTDSSKSSPREIIMSKDIKRTVKPAIIDLDYSESGDSDLETERTEFSKQKPKFERNEIDEYFRESFDALEVNRVENSSDKVNSSESNKSLQDKKTVTNTSVITTRNETNLQTKTTCPTNHIQESPLSSEQIAANSQITDMEEEIEAQKSHIQNLQQKLESLTKMVEETSLVFPTKYQNFQQPDVLTVVCRCPEQKRTKRFLLDNGRVQLEAIKEAFNLSLVEVYIDGEPCVVGANIDGYIPMKFSPSSTIEISGKVQIGDKDTSSEDLGIEELDRDIHL